MFHKQLWNQAKGQNVWKSVSDLSQKFWRSISIPESCETFQNQRIKKVFAGLRIFCCEALEQLDGVFVPVVVPEVELGEFEDSVNQEFGFEI